MMRITAHTFLNRHRAVLGVALGLATSSFGVGATLPAGFTEANWGNSIANNCTAMAFAPDGRLFVCTQNGHLRVIDASGNLLASDFLTLTVDSNGERGLLGVAFDPSFSSNQYVYVYHTVPAGPSNVPPPHNQITRYTANGNVATGAGTNILDLDNLSSATNHNGGAIHFGPDGKLYVAVGDNASGTNPANSNSQKVTNRLGKILRINADPVNPTPNDNPATFTIYDGTTVTPAGANRQIWTIGLRNPFTFAFQPGTGRLFIDDVGENTWEEINDGIAGSNYGWPSTEGFFTQSSFPQFTEPLMVYGHGSNSTSTGCAIIGGAFYNPSTLQFPASYVGKYFFGDLCNGWIRYFDPSNSSSTLFANGISGSLVDLTVGPDGALYYLVQSGQVTRIQATPSQALNISTRAQVQTGDNVLIGGFVITGNVAKKVIVRAIGPSLTAFGVTGALADPVLDLHEPGNVVVTNDNWKTDQQTEIQNSGHAPTNDLESAIVATLQPGAYTAIVTGKNGTSGVGLVEMYDLDTAAASQLINISGRAFVQTGDDVMIGGFVVGNNIGASKVIVRAIGPSLASFGVSNPLADPTLELHDGNGTLIGSNDNWQDDPDQAAAITASGHAPTNSLESAISISLAPGAYTAIVAGKNGGTGIGLVEVYKIP
jgi:glucose/arabinose dehydrogenase